VLIDKLIEIQNKEGLNGREMAKILGCSEALWSLIRTGKREISRKMQSRIIKKYPQTKNEIIADLRS
jgi:plasmid maintenance system antidote protein VapI